MYRGGSCIAELDVCDDDNDDVYALELELSGLVPPQRRRKVSTVYVSWKSLKLLDPYPDNSLILCQKVHSRILRILKCLLGEK